MPVDPLRQQQLFEQALERPPGERAAFLDGACAGDPELRARVWALLASLAAADDFLAEPTSTTAGAYEQPGAVIDRYELLQEIGEGGFGTVWMAEQTQPVRRKVALKVIKPGMDTRQVVTRFEAERQALALMEHPNIAKVFDGGITPGGRPYFVMELIRGVPITEYCDQAESSTTERLELFQQVCYAVQHAHQKGVIHRDLKPGNILVTLHDGKPVPKVIDFGVAKATSAELTQRTLFTEFRQMVGTPEYMAPEQAELSGLDIDTRADVYSLGVVLYELLTGTKPFEAQSLLDKGYLEMLRVIREDLPPKPSTRISTLGEQLAIVARRRQASPASLSKGLRGDLDWIVMKALEKERARRYVTANDLAADIGRHLQDDPVQASPPSARYRLSRFVRRHRVGVLAGAVIALSLIVGVAAASWGWLVADGQRVLAESEAGRAEQVLAFLQEMLGSADPDSAHGVDYTMLQFLDDFARQLGDEFADQPDVDATLQALLAQAYSGLRRFPEASAHGELALADRRRALGPDHARIADDLAALAGFYANQKRFDDAVATGHEALAMRRRLLGDDAEPVISNLWDLAGMLRALHRRDEADAFLQQALLATRARLGVAGTPGSSVGGGAVASTREIVGAWRSLLHEHFDDRDPAKATYLTNLAAIATEEGWNQEAEAMLREALTMSVELHGDAHPEVAYLRNALALNLMAQDRAAEAEPLFRKVRDQRSERLLPEFDSLTWANDMDVANNLIVQGKFTEAEASCRASLEKYSTFGDWDDRNYQLRDLLRLALEGQTNYAEIERMDRALLATARAGLEQARAQPDPLRAGERDWLLRIAKQTALLGYVLVHQGRFVDAEDDLLESLDVYALFDPDRLAQNDPDAWLRYDAMSLLGAALVGQGKLEEAEALLLEGYEKMRPRGQTWGHKAQARERVVELYETSGNEEEAARWRAKQE